MKCYNHHDRDAFAVCKACGKGLCLECAEEVNGEMVCKNSACKGKLALIKNFPIVLLFISALILILLLID